MRIRFSIPDNFFRPNHRRRIFILGGLVFSKELRSHSKSYPEISEEFPNISKDVLLPLIGCVSSKNIQIQASVEAELP